MNMNGIEFDTLETSLRAVLKDHQELALRVVWSSQEGANSRMVWVGTNKALKA